VLLRHLNGWNLEQFEASGHKWEFRWKDLVIRTNVASQMSVQTKYHVVQMDARDLNFTVLNSA
jgi:hypothetical protein